MSVLDASQATLWTKPEVTLPCIDEPHRVLLTIDEVPQDVRSRVASLRLIIKQNKDGGQDCRITRLRILKAPPMQKIPAALLSSSSSQEEGADPLPPPTLSEALLSLQALWAWAPHPALSHMLDCLAQLRSDGAEKKAMNLSRAAFVAAAVEAVRAATGTAAQALQLKRTHSNSGGAGGGGSGAFNNDHESCNDIFGDNEMAARREANMVLTASAVRNCVPEAHAVVLWDTCVNEALHQIDTCSREFMKSKSNSSTKDSAISENIGMLELECALDLLKLLREGGSGIMSSPDQGPSSSPLPMFSALAALHDATVCHQYLAHVNLRLKVTTMVLLKKINDDTQGSRSANTSSEISAATAGASLSPTDGQSGEAIFFIQLDESARRWTNELSISTRGGTPKWTRKLLRRNFERQVRTKLALKRHSVIFLCLQVILHFLLPCRV